MVLVAAMAAAGGGVAHAEGPGIKLGDALVLHPGFGVLAGYDSNVLYSAQNEPVTGAFYIGLRPVIDLSTLSLQRGGGHEARTLDFRLHLGSSMRFLITGNSQFDTSHISIDLDAGLNLVLFPAGNWTFELFDNYSRISVPPYFRVNAQGNLNMDQNLLGMRLRWRPGGRRFESQLSYAFGIFAFEPDQVSGRFANKNYISNEFNLRFSWKFFPKTAIYLNANETIYTYYNRTASTPPNSFPFRIVAGLIGLITPTLSIDINGGYGGGFYQSGPSPHTGLVTVSGSWKPTLLTALGIGYNHNFAVALIGSYYETDSIYISLSQQIWRIVGNLRLAWQELRYVGNLNLDGQANGRRDDLFTIHIDLNLPIKDWLIFSIGNDTQINLSNCQFIASGMLSVPACDYKRNDLWLKLAIAY